MFDPFDTLGPVWTPDPVVRSHPLNQGRAAWWLVLPGLDGGRQWFDLMGLCHGTLTSMTSASASGWRGTTRPGGWGALLFDGTDDYVNCPGVSWSTASPEITIGFWNFVPTAVITSAFSLGEQATPNRIQAHVPYSDGVLYWDYGPASTRLSTSYSAYLGAWTRVVLQGGTAWQAIFFNGVAASTRASSTPPVTNLSGLDIGRYTSLPAYHAGRLDDFAIWNRRLSAAEVQADYDLSRRGYPGVLRRWSGMGAGLMAPPGGGAWWLVGGDVGNPLVGGGLVR